MTMRQCAIYGKGGIGKSTTTQNLVAALAEMGAGLDAHPDAAWWRRERTVEQWAVEVDPSVDGAPFDLYCDHFVRALERMAPARLSLRLDGGEGCTARLSFVRKSRGELPAVRVAAADGDAIRPDGNSGDRLDFLVPANGSLLLSWN